MTFFFGGGGLGLGTLGGFLEAGSKEGPVLFA